MKQYKQPLGDAGSLGSEGKAGVSVLPPTLSFPIYSEGLPRCGWEQHTLLCTSFSLSLGQSLLFKKNYGSVMTGKPHVA